MKGISSYPAFRQKVRHQRTIHILTLGFEQRCVSYPNFVNELKLDTGKHKFMCIQPYAENMSDFLVSCREDNRRNMKKLIPGVQIGTITEILGELTSEDPPDNFCVDISSMPRSHIFQMFDAMITKSTNKSRLFCIYSYPKTYMYGPLQEPAPIVDYCGEAPRLARTERPRVIFIPGFDIEYTNVALTHLHDLTDSRPEAQWLIPFPGNKYYLYERSLESHLGLIGKDRVRLFPQDYLKMGVRILLEEIRSTLDKPLFLVPLGPRVVCVPVLLAMRHPHPEPKRVYVLLPKTRSYSSLRSEGYEEPLIEEIPLNMVSGGDVS